MKETNIKSLNKNNDLKRERKKKEFMKMFTQNNRNGFHFCSSLFVKKIPKFDVEQIIRVHFLD